MPAHVCVVVCKRQPHKTHVCVRNVRTIIIHNLFQVSFVWRDQTLLPIVSIYSFYSFRQIFCHQIHRSYSDYFFFFSLSLLLLLIRLVATETLCNLPHVNIEIRRWDDTHGDTPHAWSLNSMYKRSSPSSLAAKIEEIYKISISATELVSFKPLNHHIDGRSWTRLLLFYWHRCCCSRTILDLLERGSSKMWPKRDKTTYWMLLPTTEHCSTPRTHSLNKYPLKSCCVCAHFKANGWCK